MEVHLTVLVGVAFTAITIARILEFEAHVVDEQLLATDAEALDVSHHLDRAFKSARDGKGSHIDGDGAQGGRPGAAVEGGKVKEVGKADHGAVDFHDIDAARFVVIKLGPDGRAEPRGCGVEFNGNVVGVHLVPGTRETVSLDVGLNITRMGMHLRVDAAGGERVTDVVHRAWTRSSKSKQTTGPAAATELKATEKNRTEEVMDCMVIFLCSVGD